MIVRFQGAPVRPQVPAAACRDMSRRINDLIDSLRRVLAVDAIGRFASTTDGLPCNLAAPT